ncbi:small subunit ribosomal protein S9e [Enteropsectra breve]|nr:small subunit ribosomal protein S9e [Enteropsectra breve]
MGGIKRQRSIATTPRNPWEKERLVKELQLIGTYGLKNKTELWTHLTRAKKDKERARVLLTSTNKKEFITQGRAILDRLYKEGMISGVDFNDEADIRANLINVLNFELSDYLSRRLQTLVLKAGLARNIHHARNLITHRHIVIKGSVVNKPSMTVRSENEGHIEVNPFSSIAGYRKGRWAKTHSADEPREE